MLCIGHRGAAGYEPENTLRSIGKALRLGAPWIEIDVHAVQDRLLVIHDFRLERTTNGKGYVKEHSLQYLRSLDAGDGEKIPFLEEVFELVNRRAGINIELKGEGAAELAAQFLADRRREGWSEDAILVSSFNHHALREFGSLEPKFRLGALIAARPLDYAAFAERLGAYSVNPAFDFIDQFFVDDAHARGLKVFAYTVNHPDDIRRMAALGLDGLFSNYPDRVLAETVRGKSSSSVVRMEDM